MAKVEAEAVPFYQRWSTGHKARGQSQGHKKFRSQGPNSLGQTLSRPRTGNLEAKTKDISASVFQKKGLRKFYFQRGFWCFPVKF